MKWKDSIRKSSKKKKIMVVCVSVLVLAVVGGVLFAVYRRLNSTSVKGAMSVQEATVRTGDISNTIVGTGNLSVQESGTVTIPSDVTVTEVKVESGDQVEKGDVLAIVDRVSVLNAMAEVQEELDSLDEELAENTTSSTTSTITAKVAGRVKKIYAKSGNDVADVMVKKGALIVLSTDGYMAVDISDAQELNRGDTVTVTAEGNEFSGKVESVSTETATILFSDKGTALGAEVKVSNSSGSELGSGTAYIHSPRNITAVGGTVVSVLVSKEQSVSSSTKLLTLKTEENSATYESLMAQRQQLAESLQKLIAMSQTGSITAETAGTIASVNVTTTNESGAQEGSSLTGTSASTKSSSSVETVALSGESGTSKAAAGGVIQLSTLGSGFIQTNAVEQTSIGETTQDLAEQSTSETTQDATAQTTQDSTTQEQTTEKPAASTTESASSTTEKASTAQKESAEQSAAASSEKDSTQSAEEKATVKSSANTMSKTNSSVSTTIVTASSGSTSADSQSATTSSGSEIAAFTMASEENMLLSVSVDELDINSVSVGQEAEITLDAIEGETYTGTVCSVANSTTSSGTGVAKYTVQTQIPRAEQMKEGMNASATIVVEKKEGVLTLPVSALSERRNSVFVYTKKDEDGNLSGEQEVTTGLSDGTTVEITEGLSEGDQVYYQRLGTTQGSSSESEKEGAKEAWQNMKQNGEMPSGMPGAGGFDGSQKGSGMRGGQGSQQ